MRASWYRVMSLSLILLGASALAQQAPAIPEPLRAWVPWVLDGQEHLGCPVLAGSTFGEPASHVCAWPGALLIDADARGARFSQAWEVLADGWVPLPGDERYWPLDLQVDGRPASAALREGGPAVFLRAGSYRIAGRLGWESRPASLRVPPAAGIVELRLDGQPVASPRREAAALWLGEGPAEQAEPPVVRLAVFRLLEDGQPQRLTTRLELEVSGPAREWSFPVAVLPGFTVTALETQLPARLDAEGRLTLQVRPGGWLVEVESRALLPQDALQVPAGEGVAAVDETWSYRAAPWRRLSSLAGGDQVDVALAGVPQEWDELPAVRAAPGAALTIVARPRDLAAEEANALTLSRRLWLDFDGQGYSSADQVQGRMNGGWRLEMLPPFTLEAARIQDPDSGTPRYLALSRRAEGEPVGVELRRPSLQLQVAGRTGAVSGHVLPVSGYDTRFDAVSTVLQLPPRHRLLWARGVDSAPGAWVNGWTLLDLFLLLLIAVTAGRLFGPAIGLLALVTLAVTFSEPGAPVWSWLNLLLAVALLRVVPEGRLRVAATAWRSLSLLLVLVLLLPFVIDQARKLVYPQLEVPAVADWAEVAEPELMMQRERVLYDAMPAPREPLASGIEEITVTARKQEERIDTVDWQPTGIVPAGPGLPDWRWHEYQLGWSGPVEPEETMQLVIAGPWMVALFRLLAILASAGLLAAIALRGLRPAAAGGWRQALTGLPALLLAVTGVATLAASPPALAQGAFPDSNLLEELKQRLGRAPDCAPDCAQLEQATVRARDGQLEIRLRLHAQVPIAVPLPGRLEGWEPSRVTGAGGEPQAVTRDRRGQLQLRLGPGIRDLLLTGPLPVDRATSVNFPLPPRWIDVVVPGWQVAGISGNRLAAGVLELVPEAAAVVDADAPSAEVRIEPWLRVLRTVAVDREWTVTTVATRQAPEAGAFSLAVDLLPGESVTTPGLEQRDGRLLLEFGLDVDQVEWQSVLTPRQALELAAAAGRPWQETWAFQVSPRWRPAYEGLAPDRANPEVRAWVPLFVPAPGETLRVSFQQPAAVDGPTLAIDRVELKSRPGQRATDSMLRFDYRSTRGGEQALTLPAGATLRAVRVGNESLPLEADPGGRVTLPVSPGERSVVLEWSEPRPVGGVQRTPVVDLGAPASNISLAVELPQNRWVLATSGPRLGPAILYWSELALFLLIALIAGRYLGTPLKTWQWLLLGLGLSTQSWGALLVFAGWLLALEWRREQGAGLGNDLFNVLQLLLAVFAFAALGGLVSAIPQALLGTPDMRIGGYGTGPGLEWFADRTDGPLPVATAFNVSIWYYRLAMLAWSLWLAFALVGWARWAWESWTAGGHWRGRVATNPPA